MLKGSFGKYSNFGKFIQLRDSGSLTINFFVDCKLSNDMKQISHSSNISKGPNKTRKLNQKVSETFFKI